MGRFKRVQFGKFAFIVFTMVGATFLHAHVYGATQDDMTEKELIRDALIGKVQLTEEQIKMYDYDLDGVITLNDLVVKNVHQYIPKLTFVSEDKVGSGKYYQSVTRYLSVTSYNELSKISYCFTDKDSCIPNIVYSGNDYHSVAISLPSLPTAQRLCVSAVSIGGYQATVCDTNTYLVDATVATAPTLVGGSNAWKESSEVSVSNSSTVISGIKKYQYYISNSSTSLKGGSWKDCLSGNVSEMIADNGVYYVFFRAISNSNMVGKTSRPATVKIDNVIPTVPEITGGSDEWSSVPVEVKVSKDSKALSGISRYQYYVSSDSSELKDGEWLDGSSVTVSNNGIYYVFFRAVSNSNLVSEISNYQVVKVDQEVPTVPTVVFNYDITLTSTALSGIKYYEVDYNNDDIADNTIDSHYVPTDGNQIGYEYRFRAVSNSGLNSPWSEPISKLQ